MTNINLAHLPQNTDETNIKLTKTKCETNSYVYIHIWVFPKVPENGWFIMEKPMKMDDLGVPLFLETPIYIYIS